MHVTAISTPRYPEWRWRIKGEAGETLEQSHVGFPTTTAAFAAGTERLVERERSQTVGRRSVRRSGWTSPMCHRPIGTRHSASA